MYFNSKLTHNLLRKNIFNQVIESALASHQSCSNAETESNVDETIDRMDAMLTVDITDSVVTSDDDDDDAKKFLMSPFKQIHAIAAVFAIKMMIYCLGRVPQRVQKKSENLIMKQMNLGVI